MNLEQLRSSGPLKDSTYDDPSRLQLAHISTEEANLFDKLQGYTDEDPATGFRRYVGLLPVFNNPEIREAFEGAMSKSKKAKPNQLDKLDVLSKSIGEDYKRTQGDYTPEGQEIISHGTHGDDELAFFPLPILDYFDSVMGKPSVNKDGLPQYGNMGSAVVRAVTAPIKAVFGKHGVVDNLTRGMDQVVQGDVSKGMGTIMRSQRHATALVLPIAGGMVAGPIGSAAGTYAATRLTGGTHKEATKAAAVSGIAHAAGNVAGAAGYGNVGQGVAKGTATYAGARHIQGQSHEEALGRGIAAGGMHYLTSTPDGRMPGQGNMLDNMRTNAGNIYGHLQNGYNYVTNGVANTLGFGNGQASDWKNPDGGYYQWNKGPDGGSGGYESYVKESGPTSFLGKVGNTLGMGGGEGGFLSSIGPGALALAALSAASLFKGKRDEGKLAAEEKQKHAIESQEKMDYVNHIAEEQGGFGTGPASQWRVPFEDQDLVPNPEQPSTDSIISGRAHKWLIPRAEAEAIIAKRGYKAGGKVKKIKEHSYLSLKPGIATLVHGVGKGQDDSVVTDYLHDGDYVLDASTVSNIGDGSSDAGGRELERLMARIEKVKRHIDAPSSNTRVPAMLSDKEYVIPGRIVSKLGDGDHARGSNMLKDLVKQIRRDKIKNGDRLPPKSKSVEYYIKKAGGRV